MTKSKHFWGVAPGTSPPGTHSVEGTYDMAPSSFLASLALRNYEAILLSRHSQEPSIQPLSLLCDDGILTIRLKATLISHRYKIIPNNSLLYNTDENETYSSV